MQSFADLAQPQTSSKIDESLYEEIDEFSRYLIPATSLRKAYEKKQKERNWGFLKELQVIFNFSSTGILLEIQLDLSSSTCMQHMF